MRRSVFTISILVVLLAMTQQGALAGAGSGSGGSAGASGGSGAGSSGATGSGSQTGGAKGGTAGSTGTAAGSGAGLAGSGVGAAGAGVAGSGSGVTTPNQRSGTVGTGPNLNERFGAPQGSGNYNAPGTGTAANNPNGDQRFGAPQGTGNFGTAGANTGPNQGGPPPQFGQSPSGPNGQILRPPGTTAAGLPASPTMPGLPGFNTSAAGQTTFTTTTFVNSFPNNPYAGTTATTLAGLQQQLQQALPIILQFNSALDNPAIASRPLAPAVRPLTRGAPASGANSSGNFGVNSSGTLAAPTAGSAPSATQAPNSGTELTANNTTGTDRTPYTQRSLMLLQADIERMLMTLNAISGGNAAGMTAGTTPGANTVTSVGGTNQVQRLTPTGR